MLTTVLIFNCLIALAGFYIAWRIFKLRRSLARANRVLINAEQTTHKVLHNAPEQIAKGQIGAYQLKQRYQKLQPQLQKAQQALAVISFGQTILLRRQIPFVGRQPQRKAKRP